MARQCNKQAVRRHTGGLQGIELYGVGKWREISDLLPDWNDNELRSRTAKLLGSQSLAAYIGWRGRK